MYKQISLLFTLMGMDTLSGEPQLCQNCFAFLKGVCSKRREFAPFGSKFFPFGVDHFSVSAWCTRK